MIVYVAAICFIFAVIIACLFVIRFRGTVSFLNSEILDWVDFPIDINGYFMSEFRNYCSALAFRTTVLNPDFNKNMCEQRFYNKFLPLLFTYRDHNYEGVSNIFFDFGFKDFIRDYYSDSLVCDFPGVVKNYIKSRYRDVPEVDHVSEKFKEELENSVLSGILSDYAEKISSELDEQKHLSEVHIESVEKEYDKNVSDMRKKVSVMSYNLAVKDIKLHDNSGMNPYNYDCLKDSLSEIIDDIQIYTHQGILRLKNSDDINSLSVNGCYVVFNTYNKKYFVGRSDSMFDSVYSLLTDDACRNCISLRQDIFNGNYVLVKFIPLEDSGYNNAIIMQRDLIQAYDSCGEHGYNISGGNHER